MTVLLSPFRISSTINLFIYCSRGLHAHTIKRSFPVLRSCAIISAMHSQQSYLPNYMYLVVENTWHLAMQHHEKTMKDAGAWCQSLQFWQNRRGWGVIQVIAEHLLCWVWGRFKKPLITCGRTVYPICSFSVDRNRACNTPHEKPASVEVICD